SESVGALIGSILNDEFEAINLDDMNTIFDEEEEDLVIDYNETSKIETTIKGWKIKISNLANCDELVEKVKYGLHYALNYYWKSSTEISLVATILDSCPLRYSRSQLNYKQPSNNVESPMYAEDNEFLNFMF
ncbi:22562_t:CDS:2, partial [Gigaspora margarita]